MRLVEAYAGASPVRPAKASQQLSCHLSVPPAIKLLVSRNPHHLYRVVRPFAATTAEDGRFLTVRKGALLALEAPLKQFGLVQAECAEQTLLVYTRDIETCTECVVRPRGSG
jgi:hypothetical protein